MNRINLLELADYLANLPAEYTGFDMSRYFVDLETDEAIQPASALFYEGCGTVACALGHGPAAGISPGPRDTNWLAYSENNFGLSSADWNWCFSANWSCIDNTPQGAAARIRRVAGTK